MGPYRGLEDPAAVVAGAATGSAAPRGNASARSATRWCWSRGRAPRIVHMLGITDTPEVIPAAVARWSEPGRGRAALSAALRADWAGYLGSFTVHTPDPETDAMLNLWNPLQCRTTLYWSRFVSGYETGLGRGMGTRDSAQDTLATAHVEPDLARGPAGAALAPAVRRRPHLAPVPPPHRGGGPGARRRAPRVAAVVLRRPPLADHRHLRLPARDRRLRPGPPAGAVPAVPTAAPATRPAPRARASRGRARRHGLGPHDGGGRLHPRPSRAAWAAPPRLRGLGRHPERRPRVGAGRERLVRHAVLPGHARPRRAGRPPAPARGGGPLPRPPRPDGGGDQGLRLGRGLVRPRPGRRGAARSGWPPRRATAST